MNYEPKNCVNCGAPLVIEPGQRKVFCSHCGTEHFTENTGNGPDFKIRGGVLEKYTGESTHIRIPEGAIAIGPHAFDSCIIDELILPESLETIEYDEKFLWESSFTRATCRFSKLTIPPKLDYLLQLRFMSSVKSLTLTGDAYCTLEEERDYERYRGTDLVGALFPFSGRVFDNLNEIHFSDINVLRNLAEHREWFNLDKIRERIRDCRDFVPPTGFDGKPPIPEDCKVYVGGRLIDTDTLSLDILRQSGVTYSSREEESVSDACFLMILNFTFELAVFNLALDEEIELYDGFMDDLVIMSGTLERNEEEEKKKKKQEEAAKKAEAEKQKELESVKRDSCPFYGRRLKHVNMFNEKYWSGKIYCKHCVKSWSP